MGKGTTLRRFAAAGLIVASLAACAGPRPTEQADAEVDLKDFSIEVDRETVAPGTVRLRLENYGPTVHELVVARTRLDAAALPIGDDGLSVEEDSGALEIVDEVEEVQLSEEGDLSVGLPAGHYVLFCNLEGHYLGGMHSNLVVAG